MKGKDPPSADIKAVRRALRKLHDRDPSAFISVMDELVRAGKHWLSHLPPMEGKGRVLRGNLCSLLADYRNSQLMGVTRDYFLSRSAEEGCQYGNHYHSGTWRSIDAIKTQLTRAEKLAKTDREFAEEVAFWQEIFADEGVGSAAWGEINTASSP